MYMHMLDRRVQILLDELRYSKVAREAKLRRVSVASVIRGAIDGMPASDERRREAVADILAADSMDVPSDPADLRRELDEAFESTR